MSGFGNLRAEELSQEYQLKAAFLVNFARFITWPEQAFPADRQEFIICVVGTNPFGSALSGVEVKKISGRTVRVVFVDSYKKIPLCHLLYVSRSEEYNLDNLNANLGRTAVVTISDIPGFVKAGGSIEFVSKDNRLSFIIHHSAMKQQGVLASASLLDLAASVQ